MRESKLHFEYHWTVNMKAIENLQGSSLNQKWLKKWQIIKFKNRLTWKTQKMPLSVNKEKTKNATQKKYWKEIKLSEIEILRIKVK